MSEQARHYEYIGSPRLYSPDPVHSSISRRLLPEEAIDNALSLVLLSAADPRPTAVVGLNRPQTQNIQHS